MSQIDPLTRIYQPVNQLSHRYWVWLGALFILLGTLALAASIFASQNDWWLHGIWCIAGFLIVLPVLTRVFSRGFDLVLRDHLVMFTMSFAFYFLFGASFMTFGSEHSIASSLRYYHVDAPAGLMVDAVNGIGFGVALLIAVFSSRGWAFRQTSRIAEVASHVRVSTAMFLLLGLGSAALLYTLAYDFGFREGVVPGIVRTASSFSTVAIFLGASYRGPKPVMVRLIAVVLAIILAGIGVLLYNKTQILVSIGALVAGLSMVYRPKLVLLLGVVIMAAAYFVSSGMVLYGRNTLGEYVNVPLGERLQVAIVGFSARQSKDPLAESHPWGRLNYVPSQGAGIEFYDSGKGGDDIKLIPWVFVPRFLASQKPVLTQTSRDFHYKISGHDTSSTGQGIFSSGYYNAGWLGVFLAAVSAGWILAQTSAVATAILNKQATILLPFALYGVHIAFRIDGHFLSDYLGAFVFVLYPLLGSVFFMSFGRRR